MIVKYIYLETIIYVIKNEAFKNFKIPEQYFDNIFCINDEKITFFIRYYLLDKDSYDYYLYPRANYFLKRL